MEKCGVDEVARQIAVTTPLAVTLGTEADRPRKRKVREPAAPYDVWGFHETARYVGTVLVWLSGG